MVSDLTSGPVQTASASAAEITLAWLADPAVPLRELGDRFGCSGEWVRQCLDSELGHETVSYLRRWRRDVLRAERVPRCVDCGARVSGQRPRCRVCGSRKASQTRGARTWTREAFIQAAHDWKARYGCSPGAMDWNPSQAAQRGYLGRAARFYEDGCWPHYTSIYQQFGSWSAFLAAAGLTPNPSGLGHRPDLAGLEIVK